MQIEIIDPDPQADTSLIKSSVELVFEGVWPGFRILPGIIIVLAAMFVVQSMAGQKPDLQ